MTQSQYVIRRKLNILALGETLGNISEACRKLGVSRQHHYDIKTALEEEGLEGLLEKSRKAPRIANRVSPEIEQKVLAHSLEFPTQGQKQVANELKKRGIQISDGGVRSIWLRHNLQITNLRLKRLETWAAENEGILTESQVQALEQAKEEKEARNTASWIPPRPGHMLHWLYQRGRQALPADGHRHPFQCRLRQTVLRQDSPDCRRYFERPCPAVL